MEYVGVDLHKRVAQVAVGRENGRVSQHRLDTSVETIGRFFGQLPCARVAMEASGSWWWFVDLLEGLGHQPVLSHPKQTKAIAAARLKNDRVDAERLLMLLRGDLLPTVWIPPAAVQPRGYVLPLSAHQSGRAGGLRYYGGRNCTRNLQDARLRSSADASSRWGVTDRLKPPGGRTRGARAPCRKRTTA